MKKTTLILALLILAFTCHAQKTMVWMTNGYWSVTNKVIPSLDTTASYSDLLNIPGSTSPTSVSGSISGSAQFQVIANQANYKKILIHTTSLTGTASFTFPSAFANLPGIFPSSIISALPITSLSTTAVTITGTNMTGYVIIEGW